MVSKYTQISVSGASMWHSSYTVGCPHWECLVQIPATLLPIRSPVNATPRSRWCLPPVSKTWTAPPAQPGHRGHLGSEPQEWSFASLIKKPFKKIYKGTSRQSFPEQVFSTWLTHP